jgi:hypothetical protein
MVEGLYRVPARHPLYETVAQENHERTLVEQSWAWLAQAMCSRSAAHYFLCLTLTAGGWHLVWRDFYQYGTQGGVVESFD